MPFSMCWFRGFVHLCLCVGALPASATLIKGVSYGPVPLKSEVGASQLHADDWFCDQAAPMWGQAGRGDLRVMKQLGANMVRLYGNNPDRDHTNFLDEALVNGLSVAPGMSDFPFKQDTSGSCLDTTDFNCFSQVKPLYLKNLQNGFLTVENTYHPALKFMNILNEPDLKMPSTAVIGGFGDVIQMCRSIISAFDAMLDAERQAEVVGPLINFTATFSYAICASCEFFPAKPALGQMAQLDDAMQNPGKYGYTPRNDITAAYKARFTHSFNTQNPATDLEHQFLNDYVDFFSGTPVYIGEYHRVGANQIEDLEVILGLAEAHPLFLGISFFQYQVAYWKTGTELYFGMFGLGDYVRADMDYFSDTYKVYCLEPRPSAESNLTIPDAVARAYGGSAVDASTLCVSSPWSVLLDATGFAAIAEQQSASQMALFVERVLNHMGATVVVSGHAHLMHFASRFLVGGGEWGQMASELGGRPSWTSFDPDARCVANRHADPSVVANAIGWVCEQGALNCSDVPAVCDGSPYRLGDYLFSRYYKDLGEFPSPLESCSFQGAALYAPTEVYRHWTGAPECSNTATTTSTSTVTTTTMTSTTFTTTTQTTSTRSSTSPKSMRGRSHGREFSLVCLMALVLMQL